MLKAAEKLLEDGFYEDSVSRAYYAMYHCARACLVLEGATPKTHEGVISEFGRLFILTGKVDPAFGRALSTAKEDREDSDYEIYAEIGREEARKVFREARGFLRKAEEIVRGKR
jgi:hypothetical protein